MTPEAEFLLKHIPPTWCGTRAICLSAGLTYPGDGSANHNLAYKPLAELLAEDLIEKRRGHVPRHPRYTEYRRKEER